MMNLIYKLQVYFLYVELPDLVCMYVVIYTLFLVKKSKFLIKSSKKCFYASGLLLFMICIINTIWTVLIYQENSQRFKDIMVVLMSLIYMLIPWVGMTFLMNTPKKYRIKMWLTAIPVVAFDIICIGNIFKSYFTHDLNNLKYVNDNFGHTYGDEYLKSAADKLKALMPKDGKVFRIGGDEFPFVLKYSIENKKKIEELINERLDILSDVEFDIPGNKDVCLKVAYGYSFRNENESLKDLIDRADNKMYEMKKRMKQI